MNQKERFLKVRALSGPAPCEAGAVAAALETLRAPWFDVDLNNWPDRFPYSPRVRGRLGYSPEALYLHWEVEEQAVLATYTEDFTACSWQDACVEFFVKAVGEGKPYYNIESTCIGTVLMAQGPDRHNRERQAPEVTARILRHASLGREALGLRNAHTAWTLSLIIPWEVLKEIPRPEKGGVLKANFYKCGDKLPVPHFLSWNPVLAEKPDFHRPECFGTLVFE